MSQLSIGCFDVMVIAEACQARFGGLSRGEVHVLSYLSCVLSIYDGHDAGWWGYEFVSSAVGAPFALQIDEAVDWLMGTGAVMEYAERVGPTPTTDRELAIFIDLPRYQRRVRYLTAAYNCTLALPLPVVCDAVCREPQLSTALLLRQSRTLLDTGGVALLETQFAHLRDLLKDDETELRRGGLLTAGMIWLSYLVRERYVGGVYV